MLDKIQNILKTETPAMEVHMIEASNPIRPIWKDGEGNFIKEHETFFERRSVGDKFIRYTNGSAVNYVDIYYDDKDEEFVLVGQHGNRKIMCVVDDLRIIDEDYEDIKDEDAAEEVVNAFYKF